MIVGIDIDSKFLITCLCLILVSVLVPVFCSCPPLLQGSKISKMASSLFYTTLTQDQQQQKKAAKVPLSSTRP